MNLFEAFGMVSPGQVNAMNSMVKPVISNFQTRLLPGVSWPNWSKVPSKYYKPLPIQRINKTQLTKVSGDALRAKMKELLRQDVYTILQLSKLLEIRATTLERWVLKGIENGDIVFKGHGNPIGPGHKPRLYGWKNEL